MILYDYMILSMQTLMEIAERWFYNSYKGENAIFQSEMNCIS